MDHVEEILAEYGLELAGKSKLPDVVGRSSSLFVNTSKGKVVLKRYKKSMSLPAIVHEHSILMYLAEKDFPAPRLLQTSSGGTYVKKQSGVYALSTFMEGYILYTNYFLIPNQLQAFISAAGETLALLHKGLQEFVPEGHNPNGFKSLTGDRWRNLDWYTEKLNQCRVYIGDGGTNDKWSAAVNTILFERTGWIYETLHQLDHTLEEAAPSRLIIHGDYNPNNLLIKSNAPPVVLDFEIARLDWRITDLARSISRFASSPSGVDIAKLELFMNAYQACYPISTAELLLIPTVWQFLLIRRVIVCWHINCYRSSERRIAEIKRHMKWIDWIGSNTDMLLTSLCTERGV